MVRTALFTTIVLSACGRLNFDGVGGSPDAVSSVDGTTLRGPGTWTPLPPSPLSARVWTNAIWTGSEFAIFGGALDSAYNSTDTGARFDPVAQTWTSMSVVGTPGARHTARMVTIGGEIIEYGGGSKFMSVAGGGRYDLATDTWSPMSSSLPGQRIYAIALALGTKMFTWGGWQGGETHHGTGFLYDTIGDVWTPVQMTGAPTNRTFATGVFTGTEVLIWGGCSGPMPTCANVMGDGARYEVATDTWTPISNVGAPGPRNQHTAVWTGTEMIVFGGTSMADEADALADGAIYNPATDTWRPLPTTGGPSARVDPFGVWFGDRMVIWGDNTGQNDGFQFDPVTDQWWPMSDIGAPSPRARFAAATSPDQLFIWGGSFTVADGAVWTPN